MRKGNSYRLFIVFLSREKIESKLIPRVYQHGELSYATKFVSGVLTVLLLNDVGCAEVRCKNLSKKDH